ncbi:MAPK regulated corepressor interacting protein 2 Protein FAM195A [Channa argus]|uniref:MAPK regulated corepressor interacting protein 2 Protein FAM195A n=1 Tax=Channa argus TaxID=215402 RepID=A0A6G1QCP6_CHAAH|nr:MAPK regulated corepressor interacting protein 2 Protein FAM195A [Channa argus]
MTGYGAKKPQQAHVNSADLPWLQSCLFLCTMYTITRGPSKLVTQRRTGPTQLLENKINDFKHKQTSWGIPDLPAPKIVFNRPNGKKYHQPALALPADNQEEESFTAAHEENVKFVYEGEKVKECYEWKYEKMTLNRRVFLIGSLYADAKSLRLLFEHIYFIFITHAAALARAGARTEQKQHIKLRLEPSGSHFSGKGNKSS